ncbi:FadR/GntR family transcriptional regulator [Patulibacter defluvii]|uniref:FadR/GntR family transcriptional regulator n=1 Tax=Patulibacter defluvii TaxID=3095358 RepID=UPI002A75AD7A|nr:FCD domain-containing protein [Patulibacter sp. DM4]
MPLQSTARPSLTAQVIEQLETLIASGEWPVGTRIPPEPELVRELDVGRNTVREAVRALVHAGLLEARQGDGTYVRATSDLNAALQRCVARTSVLEAFEVRGGLERDAARLAAQRRTDDDLAAIDAALARRSAARQARDRAGFVQADVALHQAVVAATHNALLIELYGHLTETMLTTIAAVERAGFEDGVVTRAHADLVTAIRRRSPGAAERATERLLQAAREQYDRDSEDGGA